VIWCVRHRRNNDLVDFPVHITDFIRYSVNIVKGRGRLTAEIHPLIWTIELLACRVLFADPIEMGGRRRERQVFQRDEECG